MGGEKPKRLPRLDVKTGFNYSPHVLILGAGASRACCPNGDGNKKKLPLMADFIDCLSLSDIIQEAGEKPEGNFEAIFSKLHSENKTAALKKLDAAISNYFSKLILPSEPTLYDYLVLSLTEKDLIVSFNWDPLLPQAYKRWRKYRSRLPDLAFLHGNVDIGVDAEKKYWGFISDGDTQEAKLVKTPLLYPVEKKDYNADPYISDQWTKTTKYLENAYYITVLGYSAPATDVEARSLLLKAWEENPTRTLAQLSIFDIRDPDEVKKSWQDFIADTHSDTSTNFSHSMLMLYPRRTCEAFAFATLQQQPWSEDPFPEAKTLKELEDWVSPLIEEEKTGKLLGKPHHGN